MANLQDLNYQVHSFFFGAVTFKTDFIFVISRKKVMKIRVNMKRKKKSSSILIVKLPL